ncbi:uncharacterized protein LOC144622255 [Crassostrea virginica]
MASEEKSRGQEVIGCDLCQEPVFRICKQCRIRLCITCLSVHVQEKSKTPHFIDDYGKDDDDGEFCFCDSHPKFKCCVYCTTCDAPICFVCSTIKHKSHKMSELEHKKCDLISSINQENVRLQSFSNELKTLLEESKKCMSSLSFIYQQKKEEVTARGAEGHKLIEMNVKICHQELDDLKTDNDKIFLEQNTEIEDMIGNLDYWNIKTSKLRKSGNIKEMQKFNQEIKKQETTIKNRRYIDPAFYDRKLDETFFKSYVGSIDKTQRRKVFDNEMNFPIPLITKLIEAPIVSFCIDSGFPPNKKNCRLYSIALTKDRKMWMGGESRKLKLFDSHGNLHRSVSIPCTGFYICMFDKDVVFIDQLNKAIKRISNETKDTATMFTTGDWTPYSITRSASGDLLVCLRKDDQSKVVRYSCTGTVLQEIQYYSQQPLYQAPWYITENVNGDIIVTGNKEKKIIAVDRHGQLRYSYFGGKSASSVDTNSFGHVFITDFTGDKIHVLGMDGKFMRYIIPEGGIQRPRAICIINESEMVVGECLTGTAKIFNY